MQARTNPHLARYSACHRIHTRARVGLLAPESHSTSAQFSVKSRTGKHGNKHRARPGERRPTKHPAFKGFSRLRRPVLFPRARPTRVTDLCGQETSHHRSRERDAAPIVGAIARHDDDDDVVTAMRVYIIRCVVDRPATAGCYYEGEDRDSRGITRVRLLQVNRDLIYGSTHVPTFQTPRRPPGGAVFHSASDQSATERRNWTRSSSRRVASRKRQPSGSGLAWPAS